MRPALRRIAAAAALLTAAGTVQAAERSDAPAVPHLGACGIASGGFLLPGTDACLTIGGFVRAEGSWALASPRLALAPAAEAVSRVPTPASGSLGRPAFGTSARLTADMRIPTELGPVRVFVSLRGHNGVATDRTAR